MRLVLVFSFPLEAELRSSRMRPRLQLSRMTLLADAVGCVHTCSARLPDGVCPWARLLEDAPNRHGVEHNVPKDVLRQATVPSEYAHTRRA